MDRFFKKMVEDNTPKMNPHVMNGLACLYMEHVEKYIDQVFTSTIRSFPQGVEYLGLERCTPHEEFDEATKVRTDNKRVYDLAKSDFYMVKIKLALNGVPLKDKYIYLPYATDGAIMYISGSRYHITPVLTDKVISPDKDSIFVRLLGARVTFKKTYHSVFIDEVRETLNVVWSRIYRNGVTDKKSIATTKALTCIVHYLMAKHGITEMFRMYCGFTPIIGKEEINEDMYPASDWVICRSTGMKPRTYVGSFYPQSRIRIALPRHMFNDFVKSMIVGVFYVIDHFPDRFEPGYLDATSLLKILLGHIVLTGSLGENRLFTDMSEHFTSLDGYIDIINHEQLKEIGRPVDDFYGLMAMMVKDFSSLTMDVSTKGNSIYGKTMDVLYFLLYDITHGIFMAKYSMIKRAKRRPLTPNDVQEIFNKHLRNGAIYGLSSGKIVAESVSYCGDHKYPKLTSKVTEQESTPGATRGKSTRLVVGENEKLDYSMIETGCLLFLSKANPTPVARVNPYIHIDLASGTIVPNPELAEVLEKTRKLLTAKQR